MSKLSEYLKEKRTLAGHSQSQVTDQLGYETSQFCSNWERGVSFPPVSTLPTLATMYNVPIQELKDVFKSSYMKKIELEISANLAAV